MKIIYKHADLLKCDETHLLQGCNAQGVMGSGVAKLLRDADENIFTVYRQTYEEQGNRLELGQTIWVQSKPLGRTVINGITQEFYGRNPNVVYADYDAIRKVIRNITAHVHFQEKVPSMTRVLGRLNAVAMPLIGAGLANGRWSIISQIIEEESDGWQPVVYLIDGKIPDGVEAEIS